MTMTLGYTEGIGFWFHDWSWMMPPDEAPGREAVVTDGEKMAEQMAKDIATGPMTRKDRAVVRGALDRVDAPPTGRAASDAAIDRIRTRG